jgi:hypothetical protein
MLKQSSSRVKQNPKYEDLRQKICELAHTSIADEYIESPKLLDGFRNEFLSCLWFPDVSRHSDDLAAGVAGFSDEAFELCS